MLCLLRYEEEVALRTTAENEFVVLKKVSDSSHTERNEILDAGGQVCVSLMVMARHLSPLTDGGQLVSNVPVIVKLIYK